MIHQGLDPSSWCNRAAVSGMRCGYTYTRMKLAEDCFVSALIGDNIKGPDRGAALPTNTDTHRWSLLLTIVN